MGTPDSSVRVTLAETLRVFDQTAEAGEPLTATEVATALDCARRTAYDKLDTLAERGDLRSKKTGARGRVWWRPVERAAGDPGGRPPLDRAQFNELVRTVTEYAIFVLDPGGHVRSWNDGAEQIKGYAADEIIGEHVSTFYTDEDAAARVPERNLAEAERTGYAEDEGWRVHKDGGRFWANVAITAYRSDDGELRGFIKVTRDMTERHEYQETLLAEKERFESLVQEVENYAIFMLDPDGHVQSWNRGIEQIKGYRKEEIVGRHYSVFYPEEARATGVPERNLEAAARAGRIEDEGWRVRKDGTQFRANVVITALSDEDGGLRGFAKVTRDMTDQHEYEQRLVRQRDELDELDRINADIRDIDKALVSATTREEIERTVCARLAASESYRAAWVLEFSQDHEAVTTRAWAGLDERDLAGIIDAADGTRSVEPEVGARALRTGAVQTAYRDSEPSTGATLAGEFPAVAAVPLVHDDVEYGTLLVYTNDASGFNERKRTVLGEFGDTISHAITAVERKERERVLTALHESTGDLLRAETAEEIGTVVSGAATANLGLAAAIVYRFDTTDNELEPLSASPGGEAFDRALPSYAPGDDSVIWTSFVDGGSVVVGTADEAVLPSSEALSVEEAMVVALGDHGVLVVGAPARGWFDSNTQKLVELLGATAQAAFTRVESEANLRERDTVLQEQNRRLQRLNQLNTVVREVDRRLVGATTREEIFREVCELLTTNDRVRLAWMAGIDATRDAVTPLAWHGPGQGYLESVSFDGDERSVEPTVRTARTGEMTVISNIADDLRAAPWRKEAFSREFQSVISVPVAYGDRRYGVLTVYADRPGLFGEMEQSVFAELGHTIASAINTVEMKQALLTDRVVELEFRLPTDADSLLPRLARRTGQRVEFEGAITAADEGVRLFFTARGGSPEAVLEALERSVSVRSGRLIASRDGDGLFEAEVAGQTIVTMLVEHNASLRTLTATNDGVQVAIELPSSADVRDFIEQFQMGFPGLEFVAQRQRERPIESRDGFHSRLEAALTDRQLEVLKVAYYAGFFESPRGSSGTDIAEALDVSQPTVTGHLRVAQRKLLDLVFERP